MPFRSLSARSARILAAVFLATSLALAGALAGSWIFFRHLALTLPLPAAPAPPRAKASAPVSPLLLHYELDLPGRGEIFPAIPAGAADYWPLAMLTISNRSDQAALQVISVEVAGWSQRLQQSVIIGPRETRTLQLAPDLLPAALANQEVRRATLEVEARDAGGHTVFAQARPVYLHSGSDLYWGKKFANAQYVARWVTPHDEAVLRLVAEARRYAHNGRLPGYNTSSKSPAAMAAQVRTQADAVFRALKRSGFSYVSSIFVFGNHPGEAQRIRLPRETLTLTTANCIDVSVAFAAAMENIGLDPLIVIVPGHAFAGVRLGPGSADVLYLDLTVLPGGSFEQAVARAQGWLRKTEKSQVLTVDIAATRLLGIYPLPTEGATAPVASS